ncbi:MAG: excinuclease ABC subunit C [Verrucomicrobiales bacterium]|nr:excinuclease ABC subunit C [Verrucomicrobiales bacterium]
MPVSEHIRKKLAKVPHKPGVYLHKDRFGTVIYVGKARDLKKRVSQYFQPSRRMGWDLKFNALVEAIHDFDIHVVKSEPESLLLEGKLIKEFHPRYNVSFRDDKRFLLLKVNLNDSIPRFTLTRLRTDDGARYFGPFPSSGSLRRTLNLVRHRFNLRGCRPLNPTEADYKHCLYAHMKVCTAPCINNVTHEQYLMQVNAACDFLDGQCGEMVKDLETHMKKAAEELNFEKAAELRDLISDLKRTTKKTGKFKRLPYKLPVAIDPAAELESLAEELGMETPPERIEGFDISNISGTFKVASVVRFKNGRPDRNNYRRLKIKTVEGQDDFACMQEAVMRRYSRLLKEAKKKVESADGKDDVDKAIPQELQQLVDEISAAVKKGIVRASQYIEHGNFPDLIVIDGGKGQLKMAYNELKKLGLESIPVIGLAKEYEEIHRPAERHPLRLGLDHPAVKLLQRVRDESHRVANSYNAQLRLKRISESLLDEFPGIGKQRKAALLKKFGSVQRLRRATLEEIQQVTGFGGLAGSELKKFLEARSETVTREKEAETE